VRILTEAKHKSHHYHLTSRNFKSRSSSKFKAHAEKGGKKIAWSPIRRFRENAPLSLPDNCVTICSKIFFGKNTQDKGELIERCPFIVTWHSVLKAGQ